MLKGAHVAARKVQFELNLPDEALESPEQVNDQAKEAYVMELLRQQIISQGKAAELLGVSRWDLPNIMAAHEVFYFDLPSEEFDDELKRWQLRQLAV